MKDNDAEIPDNVAGKEWREKKKIEEGDKIVVFENEAGQRVVMTLKEALDVWEENTRDLQQTIKATREAFKRRARRFESAAP